MDTKLGARFVWCLGAAVGAGWLHATPAGMNQLESIFEPAGMGAGFGVGRMFEGYLVTPSLVGDRVELHPVAVILAQRVLPSSAALLAGLRHLLAQYPANDLCKS